MEKWESLWSYSGLCIALLIAFIFLYNTNLNFISIIVITLLYLFLGSMVWFGNYANPGVQMLPSLLTETAIDLKTLFMILWSICLTSLILLCDMFRRLHTKFNQNGVPINLGRTKRSIESLYGLMITTTVLLLLQMFIMIMFNESTIETWIQRYGLTNMLIIYFASALVLCLIQLYNSYKLFRNDSVVVMSPE